MKRLLVVLISISWAACAQNPSKTISTYLNTLTENNRFMGELVCMQGGEFTYQGYHGYADLESNPKSKMNSNSTFRIGSISKTMTATMIFQLIESNQLLLNEPIVKYFPQLNISSDVTIKHLLNHSSGIRNFSIEENGDWLKKPLELLDVITELNKYQLNFTPGSRHEYCNTNYYLLGHIISKIDESTFSESLKTRIATPLNLENTYYPVTNNRKPNECFSYKHSNGKWQKQPPIIITNAGGSGGVISNAKDISLFLDALFQGRLISLESLEIMTTVTYENFGSGLMIEHINNQTIYMHEGAVDGFQSVFVYVPQYKTSIVLVANGLSYNKTKILMDVFNGLQGINIEIPKFDPVSLTTDELTKLSGIYKTKFAPFDLIFEIKNGQLYGAPAGNKLEELKPISKYKFEYGSSGIYLDFNLDQQTVEFIMNDNPPILFEKKV